VCEPPKQPLDCTEKNDLWFEILGKLNQMQLKA